MLKKKEKINTFVMSSEKVEFLKYMGMGLGTSIILKEELGKIAKKTLKKLPTSYSC
jgi:hypothetical protein